MSTRYWLRYPIKNPLMEGGWWVIATNVYIPFKDDYIITIELDQELYWFLYGLQ